ncbi:type IV secretory system conjugative DNA transfer family protein [Listeria seeligeri]|uniref:type IV secretory system conjugative DNA transfer family protein n=1 Tax=Listeria seeligeri TaxID=1640 RepID=UPI0022EAAF47|nr:type IV secretory system conjugative DNA transfer family protein [Listeria seeligeri]
MVKFKRKFKDPRKYNGSGWRDTRLAAYRNKLTILAKPKGLALFSIFSWLAQLYLVNLIIGLTKAVTENTQAFFHGQPDHKTDIPHAFIYPVLFEYPSWLILFMVIFAGTSIYLCVQVYHSFRALEDIQNANSNKWEDTPSLLSQYRLIYADETAFFDGVGGVPIANIRPSVLKEFGLERVPFFDDQIIEKEEISDIQSSLIMRGEDLENIRKNSEILRKELPEPVREYGILIADENTNVIVLGITRSGKGVFFVNSDIDAFSRSKKMDDRASFFIADTKGIALRENYNMLVERGYEVLVFNTADPFFSNPFSPLFTATHNYEDYLFKEKELTRVQRYKRLDFAVQDIASLATILYIRPMDGQKFFIDNARALFRASCLAIIDYCLRTNQKHKICLYTVSKTISDMMGKKMNRKNHPYLQKYVTSERSLDDLYADYKGKSALDVFFGELDNDHPASDAYGSIRLAGGAEQTISGIASELIIALDPYVQSGNARLTADNAFDFRKLGFGDKPLAIFLVFPDSSTSNEELATLFLESSFRELVREADASQEGECPRTVIYLLDEFGNLMKIPSIGKKMSAALSRNIRFHVVLQNLGQLKIYDEAERETIYSNAGITEYIKSNDKDTNNEISDRLRKHSVSSYTRQGSRLSIKKSEIESVKDVDMLSRAELEQLQFGENVILRVSKTTDLNSEAITQFPILNRGTERMIPSFWYLKHKKIAWEELPINNTHVDISLDGYTLELLPPSILDKKNHADSSDKEKVKQTFKSCVQKEYKKDGKYYKNCREVWTNDVVVTIRGELFSEEKIKNDKENLNDGLKRLMSGTVAEFTQWLEMEDNIQSVESVAVILSLESWKEVYNETETA